MKWITAAILAARGGTTEGGMGMDCPVCGLPRTRNSQHRFTGQREDRPWVGGPGSCGGGCHTTTASR